MTRIIFTLFLLLPLIGCDNKHTPEIEEEAKNTIYRYLAKNQLPQAELLPLPVSHKPNSDFSYLYKSGRHCIAFAVNCYGKNCNDINWYPYNKHHEECPQ